MNKKPYSTPEIQRCELREYCDTELPSASIPNEWGSVVPDEN